MHGEEETGPADDPALAVKRNDAAQHDHADMRMAGERRAPGMEDSEDANAGANVFGLAAMVYQGLG